MKGKQTFPCYQNSRVCVCWTVTLQNAVFWLSPGWQRPMVFTAEESSHRGAADRSRGSHRHATVRVIQQTPPITPPILTGSSYHWGEGAVCKGHWHSSNVPELQEKHKQRFYIPTHYFLKEKFTGKINRCCHLLTLLKLLKPCYCFKPSWL